LPHLAWFVIDAIDALDLRTFHVHCAGMAGTAAL